MSNMIRTAELLLASSLLVATSVSLILIDNKCNEVFTNKVIYQLKLTKRILFRIL